MFEYRSVLVTGAAGYLGVQTVRRLSKLRGQIPRVVAFDVKPRPAALDLPGVEYCEGDIRNPGLEDVLVEHRVDTVVHLASIVTPRKGMSREFIHSVDVVGTQNVLDASLNAGVRHIIATSSGAAYGYHADNPQPLDEDDPLRGNPEFTYSDHKRQVEEMLARYREDHPELGQLVLRLCTVLGAATDNQITDLFRKKFVLAIAGSEIPFVFVWDEDVASCIVKGILDDAEGIYNVAGDGVVTLRQIARRLGKPYLPIPPTLLRLALSVLHALHLSPYGPEQVGFLQYRPVLANARLKNTFGYRPRLSSREAIEFHLHAQRRTGQPPSLA